MRIGAIRKCPSVFGFTPKRETAGRVCVTIGILLREARNNSPLEQTKRGANVGWTPLLLGETEWAAGGCEKTWMKT